MEASSSLSRGWEKKRQLLWAWQPQTPGVLPASSACTVVGGPERATALGWGRGMCQDSLKKARGWSDYAKKRWRCWGQGWGTGAAFRPECGADAIWLQYEIREGGGPQVRVRNAREGWGGVPCWKAMHTVSRYLRWEPRPKEWQHCSRELLLGNRGGGGYRDRQTGCQEAAETTTCSGPHFSSAVHTLPLPPSLWP